jgi:FtsP/CotA-like multicopper oxidase with cupredoxin domain
MKIQMKRGAAAQWTATNPILSAGEVRLRTKLEDFTGLYLQHCHLLDDQDMGMMQQVEVVAPVTLRRLSASITTNNIRYNSQEDA